MGDPKRFKARYQTPMHPWQKERIEEEKRLIRDYGLKNKTEIWRHNTQLKRFIAKFKDTSITNPKQAEKEKNDLLQRMQRLGLIKANASDDEILNLSTRSLLDRRLQTVVVKKKLARTPKQARQFITHRHITVNGKVITSPSHLVSIEDESNLGFIVRSSLFSEQHPERVTKEDKKKEAKESRDSKEPKETKEVKEALVEKTESKEAKQ